MTNLAEYLKQLADRYETEAFLSSDPSLFMHSVEGDANREVTAFIASCLSYGSRKQFMPKIQQIVDLAKGDVYAWIKDGKFCQDFKAQDTTSFYRLYSRVEMHRLFMALQRLLKEWGTMGSFVKQNAHGGLSAVEALTKYFAEHSPTMTVPRNTASPCKRICMFLRWMVRDSSPVDLGLWSQFIDKRSLIIPMDTHVRQEAIRLGLMPDVRSTTMKNAIRLTERLKEIFPDDPLRGDFALFGVGVEPD